DFFVGAIPGRDRPDENGGERVVAVQGAVAAKGGSYTHHPARASPAGRLLLLGARRTSLRSRLRRPYRDAFCSWRGRARVGRACGRRWVKLWADRPIGHMTAG